MPHVPLSYETQRRLDAVFLAADRPVAAQLLIEKCGTNLPFLENLNAEELERFRFAALKLSNGTLRGLEDAVALANEDWRDLLVAAAFADDLKAHLSWSP